MHKVKLAVIGLGKMGLSHLSIAGAHKDVAVVGICDSSRIVTDFLEKFSPFPCFTDYRKMIQAVQPDAVIVATPTKSHYEIILYLLQQHIHVFSEKPFTLHPKDSDHLTQLAHQHKLVNQVGYHNQFLGTFMEMKRLIKNGVMGKIQHFTGEAYGPVMIKEKEKTWRSDASEGGGCLMDYASHVIDLINGCLGNVTATNGCLLKKIYSKNVEDAVYALLQLNTGVSGVLSVNWSDESFRKMSTQLTVQGSNGKLICDATELKVFLKTKDESGKYTKGWNSKTVGDLQLPVDFYLRGEEYSAQLDYFVQAIGQKVPNTINTFEQAAETDLAIQIIQLSNR
jgi:predicted dehydrogenase